MAPPEANRWQTAAWPKRLHGLPKRLFAFLCVVLAGTACEEEGGRCEAGLCPVGMRCEASTGRCVPEAAQAVAPLGLHGRFRVLPQAKGDPAIVGLVAAKQSLALLSGGQTSFLAGPAASPEDPPAGPAFAAVAGTDGRVHVAWQRPGDATLAYAVGGQKGWQREVIAAAQPGSVGRAVAIALWDGAPTLVWRSLTDGPGIRLARRNSAGGWDVEVVPAPPARAGQDKPAVLDLGRSLAMVVTPTGPALSAYDALAGDLVLAVRGSVGWTLARVAGSDAVDGKDTGDMGDPSALALGPGGELVVAYRDRTRGRVLLARAKGGVLQHQVVADGKIADGATGTTRVGLLGSALAVAVLPDGRAAVAMQDGSRLQAVVAVEKPTGGFELRTLPATLAAPRPQAWPELVVQADGTLDVHYLELDPVRGPVAGAVGRWTWPAGGTP